MKKVLVTFLSLCLLQAAGWANLDFEKAELVMTAEVGAEKVEGLFKFKNVSNSPVTILKTASSCGCTAAVLEKQTYDSGEEGAIKAVFTIGQRKGTQSKIITVMTDETPSAQYRLTLTVEIPVTLLIEPSLLQWKKDEDSVTKTALVATGDPDSFKILGIGSVPEGWELEMVRNPDGTASIQASPSAQVPRKVERVQITAERSDGKTFTDTLYLLRR